MAVIYDQILVEEQINIPTAESLKKRSESMKATHARKRAEREAKLNEVAIPLFN